MPQNNTQQPKDLKWLKAQVNQEINRAKTYFMTLAEFVNGQFESPSEQPTNDPNLNFRMFLNSTVYHQCEAFEKKITGFLDEFAASEGGGIDA